MKNCEYELPKISHLLICYITGKLMLMLLYTCMSIVHISSKLYDDGSLNYLSCIQVSAWETILLSIICDKPHCLLGGFINSHIVRNSLYSYVCMSSNHFPRYGTNQPQLKWHTCVHTCKINAPHTRIYLYKVSATK